MNLKTKKIIAREFLFLLSYSLIVIAVYFIAYNYYTIKEEYGTSTRTWKVNDTTSAIGTLLFTLLFIIRYLFYAIRWSVKVLKQKNG
jgi:hypothetical protein